MKKYLLLIVFAFALTACENELESVVENMETRAAEEKKNDVNFRIFKDRTQTGENSK